MILGEPNKRWIQNFSCAFDLYLHYFLLECGHKVTLSQRELYHLFYNLVTDDMSHLKFHCKICEPNVDSPKALIISRGIKNAIYYGGGYLHGTHNSTKELST